ncbi:MAG: holo-ACP synthase [Helicobacter sp.]|nr:holo-ACP synthase [Helicobacteraceae bacterium]MDY3113574.1 holo-ACP synthase [Helicobacter sp.]
MQSIGVDIVVISRITSFKERFGSKGLGKFLSNDEIALAKSEQSLAGFWAAKEACAKALGCGIGKELSFSDIYISKDNKGKPLIELSLEKKEYFKVESLSLSISHDGGFAIAVVAVQFMK